MQAANLAINDDSLHDRLRFMQVDEPLRARLREFWQHVEPALPGILDAFYGHVVGVPHLAQLIGNDVPRLKGAQGSHWQRLFSAAFDDAYFDGVRTIGKVHNRIGLEPRWYIGAYNLVLCHLVEVAHKAYRRKPEQLTAAIRATTTAVMLDMDIAISVYQEELLAERAKRQHEVMAAIAQFDRDSSQMLETIMAAAVQLESLAQSLTDGAQSTAGQLGVIATASEQTAANVQSVAAATEQMSSTIAEITRTVAGSAQTASQNRAIPKITVPPRDLVLSANKKVGMATRNSGWKNPTEPVSGLIMMEGKIRALRMHAGIKLSHSTSHKGRRLSER